MASALTSQQCLVVGNLAVSPLPPALLEGNIPRFVIILLSWDRVSSVVDPTHLFTDLDDPRVPLRYLDAFLVFPLLN